MVTSRWLALFVFAAVFLTGCVTPKDFDTGEAIRAVQASNEVLAAPKRVFFVTTRCHDSPGTGEPGSREELFSKRCWEASKGNEEMLRLGFGMSEAPEVSCGTSMIAVAPPGSANNIRTSASTPVSMPCSPDFAALRQAILNTPCQCAFIMVTGYNTTFPFAIKRTAQMALDLSYQGLPIVFSFAAGGRFADYANDFEAAELASPSLHRMLVALTNADSSGKSPSIDIIAHSMGTRITLRAINEGEAPSPRYVVLAAPDIDTVAFLQMARIASARTKRMTVYTSKFDIAMSASATTHNGHQRAGEGLSASVAADLTRTELIDATASADDPYAHSYFAESRVMVEDIRAALSGTPASARPPLDCNTGGSQSVIACTVPCPRDGKCGPSFYARVVHWLLD